MREHAQHLLAHLKSGRAQGLDVLFTTLGQGDASGGYTRSKLRYPLVENRPLRPTFPGERDERDAMTRDMAVALGQADSQEALVNLLERFGGFVAAVTDDGREVGGVSWFDQSRLQLALAACGEEVLVVRADLSGIQDFIYVEAEKALKSLRARSFYLELISVHLLRRLLELGEVSRANVAYLGGGGFQLYLPAASEEQVLAYAQSFDDWLWHEHQGTLGLALAHLRVTREAVVAGKVPQHDLSAALTLKKARRRQGQLSEVFGPPSRPGGRLRREEQLAQRLVTFGTRLPRATHLEVLAATQDADGSWITVHDRMYRPYRQGPAAPLTERRIALNTFSDAGAFPMLTGNYVTRIRDVPASLRIEDPDATNGVDSVATHEQLVELALGQPRLALYRCDADNMGSFFSGGIPGHNAARHATLSRLMSLFFQGYVNAICVKSEPLLPGIPQAVRSVQEEHGRYLNLIYSGGDDAVVVGAWNEVLSFAVDLRRAYRRFTGNNPKLGLSGGAFIAKAKYPLRRMADRAHEAEQLAKQARDGDTITKDGFVPFLTSDAPGQDPRAAVRWNVFAALSDADNLQHTLDVLGAFLKLRSSERRLQDDSLSLDVSRTFLWKLQAFAEREGDVWRVPALHYALTRATPPSQKQAEWRDLQALLLKPGTWPHLGHVLGFLHLARPTADDRATERPRRPVEKE